MNKTSKAGTVNSSNTKSTLLLSAASAALFCIGAVPAYADCTLSSSTAPNYVIGCTGTSALYSISGDLTYTNAAATADSTTALASSLTLGSFTTASVSNAGAIGTVNFSGDTYVTATNTGAITNLNLLNIGGTGTINNTGLSTASATIYSVLATGSGSLAVNNNAYATISILTSSVHGSVAINNAATGTLGGITLNGYGTAGESAHLNNLGSITGDVVIDDFDTVVVTESGSAARFDISNTVNTVSFANSSGTVNTASFLNNGIVNLTNAGAITQLSMTGDKTTSINNSGIITNGSIVGTNGAVTVTSSGTIGSLTVSSTSGSVVVNNTGLISGYLDVASTSGSVSVTNTGTIYMTDLVGGTTANFVNTGLTNATGISGFTGLVTFANGDEATTDTGSVWAVSLAGITASTASSATVTNYGAANSYVVQNFGGTVNFTNLADAANAGTVSSVVSVTRSGVVSIVNQGYSSTSGGSIAAVTASYDTSVSITNQEFATISATTSVAAAVSVQNDKSVTIYNGGTINGTLATSSSAIYGYANSATSISNTGDIIGNVVVTDHYTVNAPTTVTTTATTASPSTTVTNTTTTSYAGGTVDLTNGGTITGSVSLSGTVLTLNNSLTDSVITGGVTLNTLGFLTTSVTTTVFADADFNLSPDNTVGMAAPDYLQTTTHVTNTVTGSDITITNEGRIGATTASFSDLYAAAAGNIVFTNDGGVGGVTLTTDGAVNLDSTSVHTITDTVNTAGVETVVTTSTTNYTTTPVGGSVTVTNGATGAIHGGLTVLDAGATVINSGTIAGAVVIDGQDQIYAYADASTSSDSWLVTGSSTTSYTTATLTTVSAMTTSTTNLISNTDTTTSTYVDSGTFASFTNNADNTATTATEGYVGGSVAMYANTTATFSNAGEIVGGVDVEASKGSSTETQTYFYNSDSTNIYSATTTTVAGNITRQRYDTNYHWGYSTGSATTGVQSVDTGSSASAVSITNLATGKLDSTVYAHSTGSIVLTNAGLISNTVTLIANASAGSYSSASSNTYASSTVETDIYTATFTGSTATGATHTWDYSYGESTTTNWNSASVYQTVAGAVSLTNTGLDVAAVGTASAITAGIHGAVSINAGTTATFINSGTVTGPVVITASSWTSVYSDTQSSASSASAHVTGSVVTAYATGSTVNGTVHEIDDTSSSFSSAGVRDNYSNVLTITGGDVLFTNSASGTIGASVMLIAGGAITASNAGTIASTTSDLTVLVQGAEESSASARSVTTSYHTTDVSHFDLADTLSASNRYSGTDVRNSTHTTVDNIVTTVSADSGTWVGGAVSFTNSGTLGNATHSTNLQVLNVGTATVVNSHAINGTVYIGGNDLTDFTSGSTETSNATAIITTASTDTYSATVETAWNDVTTTDSTSSHSLNRVRTTTSVGGAAVFTNSGTISGDVTIYEVGNASFVNSGTDGSTTSLHTVHVSSVGSALSDTFTASNSTITHLSSGVVGTYSVASGTNFTHTYTDSTDSYENITDSTFNNALGGSASVNNSGYLNDGVYVDGTTAATLTNSGSILLAAAFSSAAKVTVSADSKNYSSNSSIVTTQSDSVTGFTITGEVGNTTGSSLTSASHRQVVRTSASSWETVGGIASLINATSSVIGSSAVPYYVLVQGQAAASVANDGTIWGNVLVEAWDESYSGSNTGTFDASYGGTNTNTTLRTYSGSNTTTAVNTYVSNSSSAMTTTSAYNGAHTYSGGSASLTNTSTTSIHGNVTVSGIDSALVNNTGLITGTVLVNAHGSDDIYSGSGATSSSYASNLTGITTDVFNTAGVTTSRTYAETYSLSSESSWNSHNSYSSATVGGTATLTNGASAIIGVSGSLVSVNVLGDSAAVVTNNGKIYGNLSVSAENSSYTSASTESSASSHFSSSARTTVTKGFGLFGTMVHYTGLTYTASDVQSGTSTSSYSSASSSLEQFSLTTASGTVTVLNGTGSSITGYIFADGTGGASVNNYGSIAKNVTVASIDDEWTQSSASYYSSAGTTVWSESSSATASTNTAGNITSIASTGSGSSLYTYSGTSGSSMSMSTSYVGGSASLDNEVGGVIGSTSSPSTVTVHGLNGSHVINDGTIYGTVDILGYHTDTASSSTSYAVSSGSYSNNYTTSGLDTFTYTTASTTDVNVVTTTDVTNTTSYVSTTSVMHMSMKDVSDPGVTGNSYTGSGTLYGSLYIDNVSSASLNNSGKILKKLLGGETLDLISSGRDREFDGTTSTVVTTSATENVVLVDTTTTSATASAWTSTSSGWTTVSDTGSSYSSQVRTVSMSITDIADGDTASLTNSGTIGGYINEPATVLVRGDKGASLNNSNLMYANVTVIGLAEEVPYSSTSTDSTPVIAPNTSYTWNETDRTTVSRTYNNVTNTSTQTTSILNSRVVTSSSVYTGGSVSAVNSGVISGNLYIQGYATTSLTNSKYIYGNVTVISGDRNDFNYTTTDSSTTSSTVVINTTSTTSHVTTTNILNTDTQSFSSASFGGNATFANTYQIGTYDSVNNTVSGSQVSIFANGSASATNSGTIYGGLDLTAEGYSAQYSGTTTTSSVTTATVTSTSSITDINSTVSQSSSNTSVHTGGTGYLSNSGTIGLSYVNGNTFTAAYGVSVYGDAGATLYNSGKIGGGAKVESTGIWDNSGSGTSVVTVVEHDDNLNTANSTRTVTTASTSNYSSSATGGSASITNATSSTIGKDVSINRLTSTQADAEIIALGDTGATITNYGTIQGDYILAGSGVYLYDSHLSTVYNYSDVETGSAASTVVGGELTAYSASHTTTFTYTAIGGTASVTNAGSILGELGATDNEIDVIGLAGATLTNTGTINLYDSAINVDSYAANSTDHQVATEVADDLGLIDRTSTDTYRQTYTGGTASLSNAASSTITADTIVVSGYTAANVTNAGTIQSALDEGLVQAESIFWNYAYDGTTITTGIDTANSESGVSTTTASRSWTATGGSALVSNTGNIYATVEANGFVSATVANATSGDIDGAVSANSLYANDTYLNGVYTESRTGGTANLTNSGWISGDGELAGSGYGYSSSSTGISETSLFLTASYYNGGYVVQSYAGSTLLNEKTGVLDSEGNGGLMYTFLTASGSTNTFTNHGIIGSANAIAVLEEVVSAISGVSLSGVLDTSAGTYRFVGNTNALNTGVIAGNLDFEDSEAGASAAVYTFGAGSILTGDIDSTATALTLNFGSASDTSGGIYTGDVSGATITNKVGTGTWILTGQSLALGTTTISAGTLEFGLPSNYYLENNAALFELLGLSSTWDVLPVNFLTGNTVVSSSSSSLPAQIGDILGVTGTSIIGNITIGSAGTMEGEGNITGNVTNNGTLIPGWLVTNDASDTITSLLNTNEVLLPSTYVISGNFVQSGSSATLVAGMYGTISRTTDTTVTGTSSDYFAETTYTLNEGPFSTDTVGTSPILVKVGGTATVGGTVKVYVDKGGLYVNGQSATIVSSTGTLSSTATTSMSQSSLFVGFDLTTSTVTSGSVTTHNLNLVVDRKSYSTVAENDNQAAIGVALDGAVSVVADLISNTASSAYASVAAYNKVEDMAGFLNAMDWQVTSEATAAEYLQDLSPDGYATLAALDTGAGYQGVVRKHLSSLTPDGDFGVWGQGYGIAQSVSSNKGASGLNGTTAGLTMGFDFKFDNVLVGLSGGYARTTFNSPDRNFHGSETSYQAGAYGKVNFDQLYIDASIWGNFGTGDVTRDINIADSGRVATAKLDPSELRFNLGAGYRFSTDYGIFITPYVDLSYRNAKYGDISESGTAGGLGYDLTSVGSSFFTPRLGVTFDGNWAVSSLVTIKPLVGIGLEYQSKADPITAQFQGGGNAFKIDSAYKNTLAVTPEAGLDILIGKSFSMQLGYMGAIGGNGSTHGGWIGLRGTW
jgi:hypothetical protein